MQTTLLRLGFFCRASELSAKRSTRPRTQALHSFSVTFFVEPSVTGLRHRGPLAGVARCCQNGRFIVSLMLLNLKTPNPETYDLLRLQHQRPSLYNGRGRRGSRGRAGRVSADSSQLKNRKVWLVIVIVIVMIIVIKIRRIWTEMSKGLQARNPSDG